MAMKAGERAHAIIVIFLVSPLVEAGIRPSFHLEHCAWHATDIVVASEGEVIDGTLSVLKVFAGAQKIGDSIFVPELGQFRAKESRTLRPFLLSSGDKEPPMVLAGDKLVLFLKRGKDKSATDPTWAPASLFGGMKVSVVWISEGRVYGFTQVMNPGPITLTNQRLSEDKFEQRVLSIIEIRRDLRACSKLTEAKHRAKVAAKFVESPLYYARKEAFRLLSRCGEDALPHLRELLRDQSKVRLHDEAIKTLGVAGGEAIVPELTAIVAKELSFWKKTAPELKVGWWNGKGLEWKLVGPLRDRYSVVLEVFYTMRKLKSPACRAAVREFRDYWRSLPQLEDKSGLDQMSQACDAVLKELLSEKQ
jgi:hypothetical protein